MLEADISEFVKQQLHWLVWLFYLLFVFIYAYYYKEYVKGGSKRWILLVRSILIGLSTVMSIYVLYIVLSVIIINRYLLILIVTVVIASAIIFRIRADLLFSCKKEEEQSINGVRYILCHSSVINAWYDPKKRKIYISTALARHLTHDELKAVIHHEEGHAKNRWLNKISDALFIIWMFSIGVIMIIIVLSAFSSIPAYQYIKGLSLMYWIAAILTLSLAVSSWITEHDSDKRALEIVGLKPTTTALIKVHAYGAIANTGLLDYIDRCDIYKIPEIGDIVKIISYLNIFKIILSAGLQYPKWILEYIMRPTYPTHPPIELRLALLLHHSITNNQNKQNT